MSEIYCSQCYIEGRADPTKPRSNPLFVLIYDGEGFCPSHFDKKRARMVPVVTPVDAALKEGT